MLDDAWLKQIKIPLGEGYLLDGIEVGGSSIVFIFESPDGLRSVVKIFKRQLLAFPSYIHEIPNWFTGLPIYDVDRLNRKLKNLLGDPCLFTTVRQYDELHRTMIDNFYRERMTVAKLDRLSVDPPQFEPLLRWFLFTPELRTRLARDSLNKDLDEERNKWSRTFLEELDYYNRRNDDIEPSTCYENPLLIWLGAILESYFTVDEFPIAVIAIRELVDPMDGIHINQFCDQLHAMLWGLAQMAPLNSRVKIFVDYLAIFDEEFAEGIDSSEADRFGSLLDTAKRMNRN